MDTTIISAPNGSLRQRNLLPSGNVKGRRGRCGYFFDLVDKPISAGLLARPNGKSFWLGDGGGK